jgi:Mg-chelatase subunit ChlD
MNSEVKSLSLSVTPEVSAVIHNQNKGFCFMATIQAPEFLSEKRAPIDLVLVIDVSGSMSGSKIYLAKDTVNFVISQLSSKDRLGIVLFSSNTSVLLKLTLMDGEGKKQASIKVQQIKAGGGTALCAGLVSGVEMLHSREKGAKNDVASVLLLTDGQVRVKKT